MTKRLLVLALLASTAAAPAVAQSGSSQNNAPQNNAPQNSGATAQGSSPRGQQGPDAATRPSNTNVQIPQDLGSFPTNQITDRPFVRPDGGEQGFKKTVGALQRTLTELQQLQLQLKQAHWNVSGTLFYPLHKLLQEHYEGVEKLSDKIAERLLAIGVSSDGRATTVVRTSGIPEIPGGYLDDAQVLVWFTQTYKKVSEEVRIGVRDTNDPDPTTSNLLQEVEYVLEKYQWQTRAFFQRTHTDPNTGWDINNNKAVDLPSQAPSIDLNK